MIFLFWWSRGNYNEIGIMHIGGNIMNNMKKWLVAMVLLCLCLTGCTGTKPSGSESELSPAEISEQAMDNFLVKLKEEKYSVQSQDYLKINVFSKDLVWFDYADNDLYTDFAVMSVNDETFQGFIDGDELASITFLGEGSAVETANSRLPGCLASEEVSQGNIYNLFYNQTDEPLTFLSRDELVKRFLLNYAGYGETAIRLMEDVYLEMNDIDPTEVHFKAVVNDDPVARLSFEDIDVAIKFGEAEDNSLASAWMKAPVYPEARSDWNSSDLFIMNSVFMPGYGNSVAPFPAFASYAMKMDDNYMDTDEVRIRDSHATEANLNEYIEVLKKEGFSEVKVTDAEGNEKTVYRKLLRKAYKCYTEVEAGYDDGVNLTMRKYYDSPVYNDLAGINEFIKQFGYLPLPESDNITSVRGRDDANQQTESWLYFFKYNTVLYVDIAFEDQDKMVEYLNNYEQSLKDAGFEPVYEGGSDEPSYIELPENGANFRYLMGDNGTVSLLFKDEKTLSAEETEKLISEAGFPTIDLNDPITCRTMDEYMKVQYNLDYKLYLAFDQTFATMEEAENWLNAYEAKLNEAGFERVNPSEVGSRKENALYNEEKNMVVGIDVTEQENNTLVNFDFTAE
jgi:hypothetical protein